MGYCEQVCQLCGVTFNIGRIRTLNEPEQDAWSSMGNAFVTSWELPEDDPGCDNIARQGENDPEHFAGPNCQQEYAGYSGWRISGDEMRKCMWVQCLQFKDDSWTPESHDEDFEVAARYCFVTGISKQCPSEFEVAGFEPVKHGFTHGFINSECDPAFPAEDSLPMHPTCFQLFKRMSMQSFGTVEIDGLWQLRMTKGSYPRFKDFPERKDREITGEQWYHHSPGTEYLAANPIDVPALMRLIASCAESADELVFDQLPNAVSISDPLGVMPPELRTMLLERLERRDVANLRLTSKAFSQLPQSYFRNLIDKEMPWVWELHDTESQIAPKTGINWFALWNKLSAADGGDCADENARWERSEYIQRKQINSETLEPHVSIRNKDSEIKGLRNRRMIWRDISIILDMMADARMEQKE